ncbi:DUF3500 domain-containing protein [Croceicoccus bisphenolivorans]|uniref:DUF3500 domain-containing protein n=1 Tax=Croceicoccus bisphenolivorans TaxID=1783232 RepID=UPI0008334545|nr:DUF3500 domain-containing protein [Croceicoccus bisphenolivorans]
MEKQEEFRNYLFPRDGDRLAPARGLDPLTFAKACEDHPMAGSMIKGWAKLREQPFHGLTCDGHVEGGLYHLGDEGAPTPEMVRAANALLQALSPADRAQLSYPIDAKEWRRWSNPEFLINPNGLRMEDCTPEVRTAILRVMEASMSAAGYTKARGCMKTNAFLGELCDLPLIMNEWSYNFLLFGEPSPDKPWGWNFYGHHLCLNCFVLGSQVVISPTFMGAEPNVIDTGPDKGLRLFDTEESVGLALMQSLSAQQQERATTYKTMEPSGMPEGRYHVGDQRHLGGAFQDNRIVPYEGVPVSEFDPRQKQQVMDIVEAFVGYLPSGPLAAKLTQVEKHLDRTWWSWIGGHGDEDPFYYRIQGPVLMTEFDHHSGVWLNNTQPAKCHIHTVVRTPNGNDYGRDLLRQHYEAVHPGHAPGHE